MTATTPAGWRPTGTSTAEVIGVRAVDGFIPPDMTLESAEARQA